MILSTILVFFEKHERLIFLVALALLLALATSNRFIQDDAFISFRYAENLTRGDGLTWNPGERVEGYTNFLWTLLIAAGMEAGAEPVMLSWILGLAFFIVSVVTTRLLALSLGIPRLWALVAVIAVGTNYTFSSYATGGLETSLQTAIITSGALCTIKLINPDGSQRRLLWGLAVLCAVGLLVRLDSLIPFGIMIASVALISRKIEPSDSPGVRTIPWRKLAVLIAVPLAVIAVWFLWKLSYYGKVLPNSFYAKVLTASSVERGFAYLYQFIMSYSLYPFVVAGIFMSGRLILEENRNILILVIVVAAWLLYVVKVGGDFMEFRFMVPVAPIGYILLVWLILGISRKGWLRALWVVILFHGTLHHMAEFRYTPEVGIEDKQSLANHMTDPAQNWIGIGKKLGKYFPRGSGVRIATTAAGAIPFYSRLPAVDMLGINDPWVISYGTFIGFVPGHQRISPYEYLAEKNVNLVISHPLVSRIGASVNQIPALPKRTAESRTATIIEMPLDSEYQAALLYLTRHDAIEAAIKQHGWKTREVRF